MEGSEQIAEVGGAGGVAVDDVLERAVVGARRVLGFGARVTGHEVFQRVGDGQTQVDALTLQFPLALPRLLTHDAETPHLIGCQVVRGSQEGQDVGLVGGAVRDDPAHGRHAVSDH